MVKKVFGILIFIFSISYPFIVYFLLKHDLLGYVALLLLFMVIVRVVTNLNKSFKEIFSYALVCILLVLFYFLTKKEDFLLFYPVFMNIFMLVIFYSSIKKTPIIEKIASLRVPKEKQDEHFKKYSLKVTWAWCIFFIINGLISFATIMYGNYEIWTLYNGFISYILIGVMFAGEFLIRTFILRKLK